MALNRRTYLTGLVACAALPLTGQTAFAHRRKHGQSIIEWNERTSALEITHSLHMHDAEQAMVILGLLRDPDLNPLIAQAKLAIYVEKMFALTNEGGKQVETYIVGAEIDGGQVLIFQEAKMKTAPKWLEIENRILQDVYEEHINHMNVNLDGEIKSAIFAKGDKPKRIAA